MAGADISVIYDATYPHVRCRVAEPLERTAQRVTVRRPAGY